MGNGLYLISIGTFLFFRALNIDDLQVLACASSLLGWGFAEIGKAIWKWRKSAGAAQ